MTGETNSPAENELQLNCKTQLKLEENCSSIGTTNQLKNFLSKTEVNVKWKTKITKL